MNTCTHQVTLCQLHKFKKCEHVGHVEDCAFSIHDNVDDLCPTFRDMIEIYLAGNTAARRHKHEVVQTVKADLAELGLTVEAKASVMTRSKFKTLIERLTSPTRPASIVGRKPGPLSDYTVASHLAAFRSLTNEELADAYEAKPYGFDLPAFSTPRFIVRERPVQEISDRTARKVEILMEGWLASGKQSDRSAYIMTFFALYCGMRLGDICNLKWDVFNHTNIGMIVVYTPHKSITRRNPNGKKVSFRLDNMVYCKIEPLIGRPSEYVIPRMENRIGRNTKKNGYFCGCHSYLCNKVRRALKGCGIGIDYIGQKTIHALRKRFATTMALTPDGAVNKEMTAAACGNTVPVLTRHYLGSIAGKVT